ncbi:MAG: hypothetical protein IPM61_03030 [Chlorobi bacterium]|nr:MAG: hypothetical protein UZ07_CHB004000859 [Chlorobi bacterium OLB7]MBK8910279.1 hypothetical protein [Chlorobiota bacterium]MBX7217399.1 hypothetical protein [Candidatus Kapabacteria bacterium]
MARCSTIDTALRALIHPASLAAIILLILNDHLLKGAFPGWVTGKLSDFAGIFFFPFLLALLVGAIWKRSNPRTVGVIVFAATTTWFFAAKATPFGHQLAGQFASGVIGASVSITLDPTDLLALLALFPAWLLWSRSMKLAHRPLLLQTAIPAVVVASIGVMATSPIKQEIGVYQIRTIKGDAFAFHRGRSTHGVAFSSDHGATWSPYLGDTAALVSDDPLAVVMPSHPVPTGDTGIPYILTSPLITIHHPDLPKVWYRGSSPWRTNTDTFRIDRSGDSGQTWTSDLLIPPSRMEYIVRCEHSTGGTEGPALDLLDMDIFNDGSGVVIAAVGAGVMVRDSSGKWNQYSVGNWEALRPEATVETLLLRPIRQELFALIGLALLAGHLIGFIGWRRSVARLGYSETQPSNNPLPEVFGVKGWAVGIICALFMSLTGLSLLSDLTGFLVLLLYLPAGIAGLILLLRNAMRLGRNRQLRPASRWSLYGAFLALILPILVFVLWAFGVIEWHRHALIAAVILWGGVLAFCINRASNGRR